jgi:hypothetical protein
MGLVITLILTAGFFYLLFKAIKSGLGKDGAISAKGTMVCPTCGTRGEPKTITRGSLGMEIILWICFIVPGLIYSMWRLTTKQKGCPSCGAPGMIGVNTPMGKTLIGKMTASA